ncbi:MAG: hypothetical protein ACJ79E_19130 [Anaeromyxobacteraceae bacterium]
MRIARTAALLFATLAVASATAARAEPATASASPGLGRLKALAGEWAGTAKGGGGQAPQPTKASFRVVSGGSAVMLVTDPGTPHEMVTLFHEDDGALIATHYCAAMNQPRMKLAPAAAGDSLVFEFMDGTNLKSHPGRMQRLALATADPRRQTQSWTFADKDGTSGTMTMELTRADAPAPAK